MVPIWFLYNVEKIADVRFTKKGEDRFVDIYSENSIRYLYQALNWIEENSGYDFFDLMKDAPILRKLKFSNEEIFEHLMNFKSFIENSGYGILKNNESID